MSRLPTTTPCDEARAGENTPGEPVLGPAIRATVIGSLGRPPGLYRVAVVPLWRDHYRVNVLTGPDATSVSIPHSYFLRVGGDGKIVSASPPIVRLYP